MKKLYIYIVTVILLLTILISIKNEFLLSRIASFYFSGQFKARVDIKNASTNLISNLKLKDIYITNKKGLKCTIKDADIDYNILYMLKEGINFKFTLKDVELSYPDSNIINGITKALSIKPMELLQFNDVEGRFYHRRNEILVKSLKATGKLVRFFADGSIIGHTKINYDFRILLSGEVVANIPENISKVFFKQDGGWSEVKIYIGGTTDKPSINFSTDLFRFSIR